VRAVPRLCEFYPGIWLTTEEKIRKNLSQGKKNLSPSTVYILQKNTCTHTHILENPHTHTHTHTLQNNIKPPQYKLKQTQCKVYIWYIHNIIKCLQYKVTLMYIDINFTDSLHFTSLHFPYLHNKNTSHESRQFTPSLHFTSLHFTSLIFITKSRQRNVSVSL
jgi:hypothetical protein